MNWVFDKNDDDMLTLNWALIGGVKTLNGGYKHVKEMKVGWGV
jgi:hypothetical protein